MIKTVWKENDLCGIVTCEQNKEMQWMIGGSNLLEK